MMEVYHRIVSLEKNFRMIPWFSGCFLLFEAVFGVFGMCGRGNLACCCASGWGWRGLFDCF